MHTTRSTASGRIVTLIHTSEVLKNNPLGDPTRRHVSVYLPAAYASARNRFAPLYNALRSRWFYRAAA